MCQAAIGQKQIRNEWPPVSNLNIDSRNSIVNGIHGGRSHPISLSGKLEGEDVSSSPITESSTVSVYEEAAAEPEDGGDESGGAGQD
ncbi:hypothetical protein LINGRAHAP2_LOCUS15110 [Linum grandiflorum]